MEREQITTLIIGFIAGLVPSLIPVFKDFYFEKWKTKRQIEGDYQRHKNWVILAAVELCIILRHVVSKNPPVFFDEKLKHTQPSRPLVISPDDPFYQKYYFVVSVYRLCAFLGWLELYRQDITFLNNGRADRNNYLDRYIEEIRDGLENERLNKAGDREKWTDAVLLREEQRAIGETMLISDGASRVVMGYRKFCDLFTLRGGGQDYWVEKATNFFLKQENVYQDYRPERIKWLIINLVNLIELLGDTRLRKKLSGWREEYKLELAKSGQTGDGTPGRSFRATPQ